MRRVNRDTNPEMSFETEIRDEYFSYLCDIINVETRRTSYFILAGILHNRDFTWFVPNDDNRTMDGLKLREQFAEKARYNVLYALNFPCSMLEMLIGVARRMEDILYDCEQGDRTERWFWEIMSNLGLDRYTDMKYEDMYGKERIDVLIDAVLARTYKRNGKGGLFPLKNPKKDQRKVEIWYQMCAYLDENYFAGGCLL